MTSGNPAAAIALLAGASIAGKSLGKSVAARKQARMATISRMLDEPGATVPTAVLKGYKVDLEHAIGREQRAVSKHQENIARSEYMIESANKAIDGYRVELGKVGQVLPAPGGVK